MSQIQPATSFAAPVKPTLARPSPADMRATLANFATGVAVISTLDPQGRPFGMTVNSFNAVSLDPPLVLWSLGLGAQSLPIWRAARGFAVSILSAGQEPLSRRFSSGVEDRFAEVDWRPGPDGLPLLEGAAASFECRYWARYPGGDHEIMVGEVTACQRADVAPLVYCQGRMGTVHAVR